MPNYCVCAGCKNSTKTGHRLHGFPKDKATLRQWVHFVRVRRAHFSMTSVTANTKICSGHFKEEDYDEGDARMVSLELKTKRLAKLILTTVHTHLPACPATTPRGTKIRAARRKREMATKSDSSIVQQERTFIKIEQVCASCGYHRFWQNQPMLVFHTVCSPTQPESNQSDSGQGHTPTPPSPSVPETGGLGLLLRLAEVSLGVAGCRGWLDGLGGGPTAGPRRATRHDPSHLLLEHGALGSWSPGRGAAGLGCSRLDPGEASCRRLPVAVAALPPRSSAGRRCRSGGAGAGVAVLAAAGGSSVAWTALPCPVLVGGAPHWAPVWRGKSGHTPPKWLSFGALRHRTRVCSPTQPESNQSDSGQVRL
ncbi:THAP domain-containing protein 10 [Merluccius polli]|uniref:THAP domain-containing protein 10 n=1 Tax=Merluccius polli TaxID=89951 RepID=A0AA47P9F2_MERPO|nr:THAP domain-containing protein 10 [Merluccius polli]